MTITDERNRDVPRLAIPHRFGRVRNGERHLASRSVSSSRVVRRVAVALLVAAGLAFLIPASAHADNAAVVPHTDALVSVVMHGHTAGTVTACVSASGGPIRILSFRVHDWSRHIYTRMGGGGRVLRTGHTYCAKTGNWFRFRRSSVTVTVVNQSDGSYGSIILPVFDW